MIETLDFVATHVVNVIQVMALLVVVYGTLEAFFFSVRMMFRPSRAGDAAFHDGYVRYARWLIVGLTFQLAADIIETAFAPTWDEVGQLAAIAAIRAFINYFLERDLEHQERARIRQRSTGAVAPSEDSPLDAARAPGGAITASSGPPPSRESLP